jgi:uracil-DNA glycosylase
MTDKQIYEIAQDYNGCLKCPLGHVRDGNGESIAFGQGYPTNTRGLLITDSPIFKKGTIAAPFGSDTEELKALEKIWARANIDAMEWYHVSAIMCREMTPDPNHIVACNERLKDVVYSISPRVVVLAGHAAYYAWCGKYPDHTYGPVPNDYYKVVYTYDLHEYMVDKNTRNDDENLKVSQKILQHWVNIAGLIEQTR